VTKWEQLERVVPICVFSADNIQRQSGYSYTATFICELSNIFSFLFYPISLFLSSL
jgi:hypothetical protein